VQNHGLEKKRSQVKFPKLQKDYSFDNIMVSKTKRFGKPKYFAKR